MKETKLNNDMPELTTLQRQFAERYLVTIGETLHEHAARLEQVNGAVISAMVDGIHGIQMTPLKTATLARFLRATSATGPGRAAKP